MQGRRNKFKPDFKAQVALEALKGDKSIAELAQIYQVHPTRITAWRSQWTGREGRSTTCSSSDCGAHSPLKISIRIITEQTIGFCEQNHQRQVSRPPIWMPWRCHRRSSLPRLQVLEQNLMLL